jgi:serine phosphatase RsbU (regulator of sigma subunit)/pSer/pThr/pTyr-binding forkhead associated (FHA) protein
MPSLILLKSPEGLAPNRNITLSGEAQVIGRDQEKCQIVIPHHAVSREHAKITLENGAYFIEDLKSRNHTFVNSREVAGRLALKPDDRIKICDFLFQFRDERAPLVPKPLPEGLRKQETDPNEEPDSGGMTTIEATQGKGNVQEFLQVAPSERLRALWEISQNLSRTLDLDPLLTQIADTLFGVFRQADRCFVLMIDESQRPVPKVVKTRRARQDDMRFSRTIVKKTIESMQSYLSEDASSDMSLGPAASIAEFKIRSVMCVPLATSEGKPLGAIQLDTQDKAKKFATDDLNLLGIVANLAGVAIENARMHEAVLEREREQKEIALAREVQLGFLPQTLPEVAGYEFYSHYSPAQTVGGDYYDFVTLPDGRVAVVLGDVAGKGVPAALLVAKLSSEVRFCLFTEPNAAKAITKLNDQMLRGGLQDRFVTLSVLVLNPATHELTVVNAGHLLPKLYRGSQGSLVDAVEHDATGLPLGVVPEYSYESRVVMLDPGDTVSIYTDGVTDALNAKDQMFGTDEVERYLSPEDANLVDGGRPKRVGERLVNAVRRHAGGRPQNDDIAVVCFGRVESDTGPLSGPLRKQASTGVQVTA